MDAFLERQIRVPVLVTGQRRLDLYVLNRDIPGTQRSFLKMFFVITGGRTHIQVHCTQRDRVAQAT